jgi:hypothetical protein
MGTLAILSDVSLTVTVSAAGTFVVAVGAINIYPEFTSLINIYCIVITNSRIATEQGNSSEQDKERQEH